MSQQSITLPVVTIPLPQSVRKLLKSVRKKLRLKSTLSGCLTLAGLLMLIFWITTAIDYGWFLLQKLELPVGLRIILLAILLPVFTWILLSRVAFPLIRKFPDYDLAVIVERRFPQFQDRLITSVETSTGLPQEGPLAKSMLLKTLGEAESIAGEVSPDELFDGTPLKRLAIASGVLTASIVLLEFTQPGTVQRWWNAFILCDENYHVRTTSLQVSVIAQPGDRRCSFRPNAEGLQYLHPRGADLELEMVVPEGGPSAGVQWIVPERIRIDVIRDNGSRSRTYVSATSAKTFRFILTRLQEPVRLELLAGDYRPAKPFLIQPVSSPELDSMQIRCVYPEYTGWNQQRNTDLRVTGSDVALPVGTRFELTATSSKPLQSVRVSTDAFEVHGDREGSQITSRTGAFAESAGTVPAISSDGLRITWMFEVAGRQTASDGSSPDSTAVGLPSPDDSRLPVASNTPIRFFLHDEDNVMSMTPQLLRIDGIEDKPPEIAARGFGVDNAVTRMARIPVTGRISDDYGLQSAEFQFLVDDESVWRPRPFRSQLRPGATEFLLTAEGPEASSIFEVTPLELSEGQTLTVCVSAADGNSLQSPGLSRSEPMVFRIVSPEDLLSQLYLREINLRRRFEEVISQLQQIDADLDIHLERSRKSSLDASGMKNEDRMAISTCASRSGDNLRRQTNELVSIADGFEEIVRQLVNNSIPPGQIAEDMKSLILRPLRKVIDTAVPEADRALGSFRVAAIREPDTTSLISESRDRIADLIRELQQILEQVRDMAEFHEAIRDLKAILEEHLRIHEETKALQKRDLIDRLKLLK